MTKKKASSRDSLIIQSVSFDKEEFTKAKLLSWLKKYRLKSMKIEQSKNRYKARILSPPLFNKNSYVTHIVTPWILMTLGRLKK